MSRKPIPSSKKYFVGLFINNNNIFRLADKRALFTVTPTVTLVRALKRL